jgi:hypothetical protein
MAISHALCALALLAACWGEREASLGRVVTENGVLRVVSNDIAPPGGQYPCITSLAVNGTEIVPPIAVGALFQMDVRSFQGDLYNPTQSGACLGLPSRLAAWQQPWGLVPGAGDNGLLLGVQPRPFLNSTGACTNEDLTPYFFNWGIQLGDGAAFPREAMIVYQDVQRTDPRAAEVDYRASELPTVYYGCDFAQYAFYMPRNDSVWVPWNGTNFVPAWSGAGAGQMLGYGNMRCNGPDPRAALCAATYTGLEPMLMGGVNNLAGGCPANVVSNRPGFFNDTAVHSRVIVFAVGNVDTINAAIAKTSSTFVGWGDF